MANFYFSRQERISSSVKESALSVTFEDGSSGKCVKVSDLTQVHHMSNLQQTVQDIHDILKSYYKVARKRFTDNMCMQAADYYLVTGPAAPMKLFSPSWIYTLSDEQMEQIAGEEFSIRKKRRLLQRKVKELETGRKILL